MKENYQYQKLLVLGNALLQLSVIFHFFMFCRMSESFLCSIFYVRSFFIVETIDSTYVCVSGGGKKC